MLASGIVSTAAPASMYARDQKGRSAFLLACLEGNEEEKAALLKSGLTLDLHEAAAAGDGARAEKILARNAGSANHRDLQDASPLHYAAACGQVAVANILLMKGADLSAAAEGLDGATPAHLAATFKNGTVVLQMLETLVGNGASPNALKTDGTTPLHIATEHGHAEAVRLLIRRGADPAVENATGATIDVLGKADTVARDYQAARFRGIKRDDTYGLPQSWINEFVIASHFDFDKIRRMYAQCPDLLLTRATWDEIGVEAAAHMGREDMANFFIERGSPVSMCTACMLGLKDEIQKLLEEEPRIVRERGAHDFPLIWYTAFGQERPEILEMLLAAGADIHDGMMGNTIVQLAEKKKYNRLLEIARIR